MNMQNIVYDTLKKQYNVASLHRNCTVHLGSWSFSLESVTCRTLTVVDELLLQITDQWIKQHIWSNIILHAVENRCIPCIECSTVYTTVCKTQKVAGGKSP